MRVVGGELSGRVLSAKVGAQVRPTSDLVRGAIANMVEALVGWEGAVVADLCCGTGGLGIEALSRGAAEVTFVDSHAGSVAATRSNLAALGLEARTVKADAVGWARARQGPALDVVLVDPPYAWAGWEDLLGALAREGVLAEEAIVVAESDREVAAHDGWDVRRVRKHGGTVVSVLAQTPGAPA